MKRWFSFPCWQLCYKSRFFSFYNNYRLELTFCDLFEGGLCNSRTFIYIWKLIGIYAFFWHAVANVFFSSLLRGKIDFQKWDAQNTSSAEKNTCLIKPLFRQNLERQNSIKVWNFLHIFFSLFEKRLNIMSFTYMLHNLVLNIVKK